MIATSGFLAALGCSIFVFARGSTWDPDWVVYSAPPDPVAVLNEPIANGKVKGMERRKRRGKGKFMDPPLVRSKIVHKIWQQLNINKAGVKTYAVIIFLFIIHFPCCVAVDGGFVGIPPIHSPSVCLEAIPGLSSLSSFKQFGVHLPTSCFAFTFTPEYLTFPYW